MNADYRRLFSVVYGPIRGRARLHRQGRAAGPAAGRRPGPVGTGRRSDQLDRHRPKPAEMERAVLGYAHRTARCRAIR
jgi:hypothetical protein